MNFKAMPQIIAAVTTDILYISIFHFKENINIRKIIHFHIQKIEK